MAKNPIFISPFTRREMRIYAIFNVLFLAALYGFNIITLNPPLSSPKFILYSLFTILLAAEYWVVFTRIEDFVPMGRLALVFLVFVEGALVLGIVYLLGHQATIYIFLLVFDGYTTAIFTRRWQAVLVVGVLGAMVGLGYAMQLGWQEGLHALGGDLFWIALAVASAEIYVRQWEQREHIEELHGELEEAHLQLRDYTRKAEDAAVMHERARLAHEVHDTLGHTLTALDVQLSLCARLPAGRQAERDGIIERAGGLVRSGLADLRRAVKALKPEILETFTLTEALQSLIHDFQTKNGIQVSWRVEGEPHPLPQSHALLLYHGATEALTNVRRHAPKAEHVEIRLGFKPSMVTLMVSNTLSREASDESENPLRGSGGGLQSLAERSHELAGSFRAGMDEDGNFTVRIELPVI